MRRETTQAPQAKLEPRLGATRTGPVGAGGSTTTVGFLPGVIGQAVSSATAAATGAVSSAAAAATSAVSSVATFVFGAGGAWRVGVQL